MSLLMNVGVVSSLIAGTIAGTLGVLAWRQYKGTPFGRLLAILPLVYAGFVGFHAFIIISGTGHGGGTNPVAILETLAFAGLTLFTLQAVWLHRSMSRRPGDSDDT